MVGHYHEGEHINFAATAHVFLRINDHLLEFIHLQQPLLTVDRGRPKIHLPYIYVRLALMLRYILVHCVSV